MMNVGCAANIENPKTVFLVTHATEIFGPPHALKEYIIKQTVPSFYFITHPLPESKLEFSEIYYKNKRLLRIQRSKSQFIQFIKEFFITLYCALKQTKLLHLYIGTTNFDCLPGILLKKFKKVRTVIFYGVDYSEKRFDNKILNAIYNFLDIYCIQHADYVFSNTKRAENARVAKGLERKKSVIVPNGVFLDRIPKLTKNKIEKNLMFVGHLSKTHGVQELLEVFIDVQKKFPKVKLKIIGTGPYESKLRINISNNKKLKKTVLFLGRKSNEETLQVLAKENAIGIAPYTSSESWVKYCDPLKIKEYLACGLPVITTRLPEISKEIEKSKAGFAVNSKKNFRKAIISLIRSELLFESFKKNALKLAKKYDWNNIFDEAFAKSIL